MKWLAVLDTENHTPPQNFQAVSIWFRSRTRFSQQEEASFRQEFYQLMSHVDRVWEREMADTPQKIWNDFSDYQKAQAGKSSAMGSASVSARIET